MFNGLTGAPTAGSGAATASCRTRRSASPGTPDEQRTPINCGVWRYHPTREVFEVVAHGTTNPWGLDFDDYGEVFITNCVIPHLFHVVPGVALPADVRPGPQPARLRPDGRAAPTTSTGPAAAGATRASGGGKHDEAGGGHAHVGGMIYLGDNWPDRVPQHAVHLQHPRPPRQQRHARAPRRRLQSSRHTARTSSSSATPGSAASSCKYGPDGGVYRHRLVRHRRMPRERCRRRAPRERPDLQDHLRRRPPGQGRPGEARPTRSWRSSSSTRMSGTSALRVGCSRSGPRPERIWDRRIACSARSWRPILMCGASSERSGRFTPPAAWTRRPGWRCSAIISRRSGPGASDRSWTKELPRRI